jgi:hypothetical protein
MTRSARLAAVRLERSRKAYLQRELAYARKQDAEKARPEREAPESPEPRVVHEAVGSREAGTQTISTLQGVNTDTIRHSRAVKAVMRRRPVAETILGFIGGAFTEDLREYQSEIAAVVEGCYGNAVLMDVDELLKTGTQP